MATVECLCPRNGAEVRHPDGDSVTLRERLDFRGALAARNTIAVMKGEDPDVSAADILAGLTEAYLIHGIESWSVLDGRGKRVEVSPPAIREYLLSNTEAAMTVGDEADGLYASAVLDPLVARASNSSPRSQTPGSTSATNGSGQRHPRRSKLSSTTTTQMDGIAATT